MARQARILGTGERVPPFPTRQMVILAICRLCEPIAFTSIFPYIYFMIEDFHETDDRNQISTYAGLMTTAFALAEFSTSALWGRLSDKIGRKPVVIIALLGTAVSMIALGLSPNITAAMLSRVLAGALNGNISVMQTVVGEMVTVKEHQARAYMVMPLVWGVGSILGPMLGGALARPCISYPGLFPEGSIWDRWPYLLPNLVSALLLVLGVSVGALFMEETNPAVATRRDPALEFGNWMCSLIPWPFHVPMKSEDEQPSLSRADTDATIHVASSQASVQDYTGLSKKRPVAFNRQVLLNISSYGILAFHSMTFEQLYPMVLSTEPREDRQISWPFKFVDGYGMDTKDVGFVLSMQGVYSMFFTALVFPYLSDRIGPLRIFKFTASTYWLVYFLTPYSILLPKPLKEIGVYVVSAWKTTYGALCYPANAILLINSVTDMSNLGIINGVAAATASLCRSFSPAVSGYLYSLGLRWGYAGLPWWTNSLTSAGGLVVSLYLSEDSEEQESKSDDGICDDETPLLSA